MIRRLLLVGFLLVALRAGSRTAAAQPLPDTLQLDLTKTLQRSLAVSPEVDQIRAQRQRAAARYDEARANRFLTSFSLNTAHSFAPGLTIPDGNTQPLSQLYLNPNVMNDWSPGALRPFTDFQIVAQQPIWTWGELSGNIRAARFGVQVEAAQVDQKALEVSYRTGELYYNVQLARALNRLAQRTGDIIARAKREVQRLLDEGAQDVDQADLYEVRLTEQEYQRRLVEVGQGLRLARSALRRQLLLPDATVIVPPRHDLEPIDFTLHPDSLAHYIALGVQHRPELDQAKAGIAARSALVDVAKSDYYPKLGLQASYGYSFTLPDRPRQDNAFIGDAYTGNRTRTGLGIRFNLDFPQTKTRVEQAQAQLQEVRYQQEAAQQLVRYEIEDAYRNLIIARADMASRDDALTITDEWLRTEQINFDLDIGSTENLVKAVRANLDAKINHYQAVKQFNMAVLRLWRATGVLAQRAQSGMLIE